MAAPASSGNSRVRISDGAANRRHIGGSGSRGFDDADPVSSGDAFMRSSGGGAYRRHSGGSDSRGFDEVTADPISKPQLLCGCKIPLCQKKSHTARNPDRDYYVCGRIGTNEPYSCNTWIWVDAVRDYVEQMINVRVGSMKMLEDELAAVQKELEMKSEALMCRELDMAEQASAHQIETIELKSQILFLQSQIKALNSAAAKCKKIRMLMVMYVAVCRLGSGSLPMTLAATVIAVLMWLV